MSEITIFARQSPSYARLEQRLKKFITSKQKARIKLYDLADISRLQKRNHGIRLYWLMRTPVGMSGEAMPLPSSILLPSGILVVVHNLTSARNTADEMAKKQG